MAAQHLLHALPAALHSRRSLLLAAAGGVIAGCGGDPSPPNPGLPLLPRPPVVPVDGPPWDGFGGDAQHSALGRIATQQMRGFYWYTPVDMNPVYSGGALITHYGSPLITRHNTVLVPVKIGGNQTFRVQGRVGATGDLLWQLTSDYIVPPARWIASFNPALSADSLKMAMPIIGGRVQIRDNPDNTTGAVNNVAFYGNLAYAAAPALFNAAVVVNTPLTYDTAGNLYFGFQVLNVVPNGPASGGIARIGADGSAAFVTAPAITGDASLVKPQTNCAPALSADGTTLYVVFNTFLPVAGNARGRLVALDAATLALRAQVALTDPATGSPAWISDDATSSPLVGPDGDVYIGVLESDAPGHNYRGWLLHFNAALSQSKTPGSFGWDNTPSIVPAAMLGARYSGSSSYLLLTKYNNYAGAGSGDGRNRMAILDPNDTQGDPVKPASTVMKEVDHDPRADARRRRPGRRVRSGASTPAAVDPFTRSVLVNNEDGILYRWDLPSNSFSERIAMNAGVAQSVHAPPRSAPTGASTRSTTRTCTPSGSSGRRAALRHEREEGERREDHQVHEALHHVRAAVGQRDHRHHEGQHQQHQVFRLQAQHQRHLEPHRGDGDHRNRQPDAGDRRAVGEVEAGLQPVHVRGAHRGHRFGQQHQQRDHDADHRLGRADGRQPASIDGDSTLARPTTATRASSSRPKLAAACLLGGAACASSFDTSPRAGNSRGVARSARTRTPPTAPATPPTQRPAAERVGRARRAGGERRQHHRQRGHRHHRRQAGVGAFDAERLLVVPQATHHQAQADHAVADDHHRGVDRVARQTRTFRRRRRASPRRSAPPRSP